VSVDKSKLATTVTDF